MPPPDVLERARQLAASGRHGTVTAIKVQLKLEGYGGAEIRMRLADPAVQRKLEALIRSARDP